MRRTLTDLLNVLAEVGRATGIRLAIRPASQPGRFTIFVGENAVSPRGMGSAQTVMWLGAFLLGWNVGAGYLNERCLNGEKTEEGTGPEAGAGEEREGRDDHEHEPDGLAEGDHPEG